MIDSDESFNCDDVEEVLRDIEGEAGDIVKNLLPDKSSLKYHLAIMNLMFRKNFREQKCGGGGKGSLNKPTLNRHANKRLNREQGYTPIEEQYYRTHLFFSPRTRSTYNIDELEEPRCGPMTGTVGNPLPLQSISPPMSETDLPQPLVIRSPSETLMKWPQTPTKTTPTRQVNFNRGNDNHISDVARTLSELDRDCFIIPVHSLDRFLPAGVPMPKSIGTNTDKNAQGLNVLQIPDPKLCILCHLMSPLEAIDPVLESPLAQPLLRQRIAATELVTEISQTKLAATGMLLANMERNAEFPFISYYIINSIQTNPVLFYNNLRTASLKKFDPRTIRYTAAHTLDLYTEVATICRPPINDASTPLTKINSSSTGYIISVYKVFEGDDREKFERNWLYWTGARMIYRYLPIEAGLKRIALHKSLSPKGDKMYLLVCECSNLLNDVTVCALLLPALRARLTGYTGLFRPLHTF
ncbi:hypothetical protein RN001_006781 [Aquatica leii]|uniref:DUF7153 domain-containing protein n=1 Tax=Aquatica leii TaxID=1421715 RepID=A0AAN7Q647_9COLE|nr:hypothetical protein RN001_006781 [Aquatica leii]